MESVTKIYKVHTILGQVIIIQSYQKPITENGMITFVKLSKNIITFNKNNIIYMDESNYEAGAEQNK